MKSPYLMAIIAFAALGISLVLMRASWPWLLNVRRGEFEALKMRVEALEKAL